MSAKFVVSHLEQQSGPFDEATLKAKWLEGEFLPIDYVFDEQKQDWVLIAERFEWAKKPAQVAPPPIKKEAAKKKSPPPAPPEAVTMSGISLSTITVPTLNVPMPKEVEPTPEIELEPQTKITPAPQAAVETAASSAPSAKVEMIGGIAEVDLSAMVPGQVEIVLNNAGQEIKLNLQVRSAEPARIEWNVVNLTPTVGQDLEVNCRALDKHGHLCSEFGSPFSLKANEREYKFEIVKGTALVKFQQTKAEKCALTLHNLGTKALEMPSAVTVEWQPGPAVRLILEGTPELVAGSTQKVQVKAVDQYGNLAKSFQGTLNLEVKAS